MIRRKRDLHIQEQLAHRIVRRTTIRGVILTVFGAVLWALSSACGQFLIQKKGFNPEWLSSTRILFAGLVLTLIGVIQNKNGIKELFKNKKDLLRLLIFGVAGYMLAQYSFLQAVEVSNAATATVLQYTAPIMIVAFVCVSTRRAPTLIEAVSIVLAVTGVFLLSTHGSFSNLSIDKMALIWGLLSAVGMVFFSLMPTKMIPKYGSILVTGLGMLTGGIVMLFIARPWNYADLEKFDFAGILAYTGFALGGAIIGYTLYTQGVADIGSAKASMIASIEPVTSAVFAAFLGTMFGPLDIVGMVCIVITIILLSMPPKKIKISFHHPKTTSVKEKKREE